MPWFKCWSCHRVYEGDVTVCPECAHGNCLYKYDRYKKTRRWTLNCVSCGVRSGESDRQFMMLKCPDCQANAVLAWVPLNH